MCQAGAEEALKAEVSCQWPGFRLAFSRPGFVTFKTGADLSLPVEFDLRATFARTYCMSMGKLAGTNADRMANQVWRQLDNSSFDHLHVWQRDLRLPGERGFEPGVTPLAQAVGQRIAAQCKADKVPLVNRPARRGQRVVDCVLVEPTEWWLGYHTVTSVASRWPGGVPRVDGQGKISRAYLKMREALEWSQLPVVAKDVCAEIGCAPGGATQLLLEKGLRVTGIDPAEVDPILLANPNFVHRRMRAADMKRRDFQTVKWLFADANVAPRHTLDSVESIVTHRAVRVRGLMLTLKLLDWRLAAEIPEYVDRVRSWGFRYIRTRQLAFNRREFCLSALRSRAQRRPPPRYVARNRSRVPRDD